MDKVITTAFLIIVSVILSTLLFQATYPAIVDGSNAIDSAADNEAERLRSRIEVIHMGSELDASGTWSDVNGNGEFDVIVWVKNIGATQITALENMDIFFGEQGNFARIPHETRANGAYPNWTWSIENAEKWNPTATLRIEIHYTDALSFGRYFFKVITPTGIEDEYFGGV